MCSAAVWCSMSRNSKKMWWLSSQVSDAMHANPHLLQSVGNGYDQNWWTAYTNPNQNANYWRIMWYPETLPTADSVLKKNFVFLDAFIFPSILTSLLGPAEKHSHSMMLLSTVLNCRDGIGQQFVCVVCDFFYRAAGFLGHFYSHACQKWRLWSWENPMWPLYNEHSLIFSYSFQKEVSTTHSLVSISHTFNGH